MLVRRYRFLSFLHCLTMRTRSVSFAHSKEASKQAFLKTVWETSKVSTYMQAKPLYFFWENKLTLQEITSEGSNGKCMAVASFSFCKRSLLWSLAQLVRCVCEAHSLRLSAQLQLSCQRCSAPLLNLPLLFSFYLLTISLHISVHSLQHTCQHLWSNSRFHNFSFIFRTFSSCKFIFVRIVRREKNDKSNGNGRGKGR